MYKKANVTLDAFVPQERFMYSECVDSVLNLKYSDVNPD